MWNTSSRWYLCVWNESCCSMCLSQSIKHIWIHLIGLNTSLWPWQQGGTGSHLESNLSLKNMSKYMTQDSNKKSSNSQETNVQVRSYNRLILCFKNLTVPLMDFVKQVSIIILLLIRQINVITTFHTSYKEHTSEFSLSQDQSQLLWDKPLDQYPVHLQVHSCPCEPDVVLLFFLPSLPVASAASLVQTVNQYKKQASLFLERKRMPDCSLE